MTPELLQAAGVALYGPRWQRALAAALGVDDRLVRFWVAGERGVPAGLAWRVDVLITARLGALHEAQRRLRRQRRKEV